MKQGWAITIAIAALVAISQAAGASDIVYTNSTAFDAAAGGLSTQTFAGVAANLGIGPGEGNGTNNPLDNSTNSAMLPGLSISGSTNEGGDVAVLGPGFNSQVDSANYSVFENFGGSLIFTFAPGDTAASLGLLSAFNNEDVSINVFDDSSTLIGTFSSASGTSGAGVFWGITTSGDTIGSIEISAPGEFAGADQVQFNSGTPPVPEPGTFLLLGTGLTGIAGTLRRKLVR